MSRTFSMEMWAKTKSSAAKVSQLADIHDKPLKKQKKKSVNKMFFFST